MSQVSTIDIVRATPGDASRVSDALARAFEEDPVFRWVAPDPDHRRAALPGVFATFTDLYLSHDETYLAGTNAGAALWAPAGEEPIPEDRLETLAQGLTEALGESAAARAFELDERLQAHHPGRECFYLQFVGVVPEHRGRGLGSRMLSTVLDRCDADGTAAYLEATSEDNRRLYARHGFETVEEVAVTGGPTLWPMWRDPA